MVVGVPSIGRGSERVPQNELNSDLQKMLEVSGMFIIWRKGKVARRFYGEGDFGNLCVGDERLSAGS